MEKIFANTLDKTELSGIIDNALQYIAELCKGSTTVSESVCRGSNPCSAAKKPPFLGTGAFSFKTIPANRTVKSR